jgi:hypothetical protein
MARNTLLINFIFLIFLYYSVGEELLDTPDSPCEAVPGSGSSAPQNQLDTPGMEVDPPATGTLAHCRKAWAAKSNLLGPCRKAGPVTMPLACRRL